ncbi:protein EXECUTER 1, chloroplastic [Malania oleifera]|uniref:protein EXECUTER 1, chloroplastic n=1 Tax=Malania oleifera TaxID=397392 RepID=UPI0025AE34F0|nr:protein EXECUTER 1, chloroplastic [Malania oleifera]
MATISPPTFPSPSAFSDPTPHKFTFRSPKFSSRTTLSSRLSDCARAPCRCHGHSDAPSPSDDSPVGWRWDSVLHDAVKNAIGRFDSFLNSHRDQVKPAPSVNATEIKSEVEEDEDWGWDRWKQHFAEVDHQERTVSVLKSQLGHAVHSEDYEDAARLKVAIAAAATNDIVGRVIFHLNRAIEEEHYQDAAFIRDYAGAGLIGWWAGISEDTNDPYGRIIRISAEYGRYVARSYSPRQLATATATTGVPLFEIFLTMNKKGQYKQQVVYLKQRGVSQESTTVSSKSSGAINSFSELNTAGDKSDISATTVEDVEDDEDRDDDAVTGLSGFQNILRDMIPGVKVKVLKVTASGKVDRDLIARVIEQITEEEDEENDTEPESVDAEDEISSESDREQDEIEVDTSRENVNNDERSEIAVKVIVGGLVHKLSNPTKDLLRVPARLVKKGRSSFSFSIEKDNNQLDSNGKRPALPYRKTKLTNQRSINQVMFDLAKVIGREKIPLKVLKDVGELINLTLSQAQNRQPLSGSTTFNRIEIPASRDPLNGLYIGAHGIYTSEIIHMRRKFGHWQEDGGSKKRSNLEFYEYVEALKLTGDPYVPAGQVAFRAKVGKRYQLPHKGIIPEEFGVIARYRGQGRLAEPGFRNPRWVDGELIILDGKL